MNAITRRTALGAAIAIPRRPPCRAPRWPPSRPRSTCSFPVPVQGKLANEMKS